jgi:hypothetical protein
MKDLLQLTLLAFTAMAASATEFHVAITGSDAGPGTQAAPLRTIQRAADLAQPGDTVTVHAGVYREYVNPPRGGESDAKRIVYQAVAGEKVVITGSEEVKNWEKVQDGVWKATLPNTFFGSFNPFAELIAGDWFHANNRSHHAGAVYLNGHWLTEAVSLEEVLKPMTATPLWFASVDATRTVIWAQFKDIDPNAQQVEVNARRSVFYPDKPGRNYITVRGFTLRNAATPWAPPTVEQIGLIGVHWSKGWIIEDNDIAYSTCSGITLGKYGDAKDQNTGSATGYVTTIERGLKNGWNKETIGHHVVRDNRIAHCEQAGIVGSLGAAFSTVSGNSIHDIHVRQLFSGAEMAGIKFHGPIDTTIRGNHIYRTCRGIWLDWMTQGTRVSNNLCHDNATDDLFVEVNHGPFVVDNNIFLSPKSIVDDSQGGAYAHNLIAGGIDLNPDFFDGRKTPHHKPHSTEIAALHDNPSGDNHYYNNLFMRGGSLEKYDHAHLPMWMDGNVFFQGAKSSKHEKDPILRSGSDPVLALVEKNDGFYLTMTLATALGSERPSQPVTSAPLGKPTISGCPFENPDGSPITIGTDYFGKPRNAANPTPGPFEAPGTETLTMKVWPLTLPAAVSTKPIWGTSPITEPYPYVSTGSFSGPAVPGSPDPLVAYRWPKPKATDSLEIYLLKPSAVSSDTEASFDNLGSLTTDHPNVIVNGAGSIRMDFGRENAAWLEFDSPDCPGDVEMSISEYNQPGPGKTKAPVKHGNTYRLELNADLYEGVRFGWIHVKAPVKPWRITGIRAVCQVKPTNYDGSFSCSDPLLTKIWHMASYSVKASLCKDYFGAILMDRGDRMSWTGDAHTSQAAALVAFGNFDFIRKNIDNTSEQSNGIRSYSLYWVLSLLDYYKYSGDAATLERYIKNVCAKLDDANAVFGTDPSLRFYGWDERLCAGFEIWFRSCQEAQNAYKMLSIRAWSDFAAAMGQHGRKDLQEKYSGYAKTRMAGLRESSSWSADFGLHAAADAINTGTLRDAEKNALFEKHFLDRVNRLSLSPFNQYFIIQAMGRMGKHDDALSSIRDMWGGMIHNGGTTTYEVYRPSWNDAIAPTDAVPNSQSGIVSLCHPWGAGVVKWLNEELLGIVPTQPGFKTYDIMPHPGSTLKQVSGETPTPFGRIAASFDLTSGLCTVSTPTGTIGRVGIPKVARRIVSIHINGKLAWDGAFHAVEGIEGAKQDEDFVIFSQVRPGTYAMTVVYEGETPAYDEPAVKYAAEVVRTDTTTSGDWGGVYGKDGFVLCNYHGEGRDETALPPYVSSVEYYRAFPKSGVPDPTVWATETSDKRALAPDTRNSPKRNATCYSNSDQTMSVTVGIKGRREYQIALYFVDWDKSGSRAAVEMFDADTLNLIAPVKVVDKHSGGVYLVYTYDKSVKFRFNKVRGSLVTLSGMFFDPAASRQP